MNKIILSMMAFAVSALCEAQPWMNIHDNEGNVYSLDVNNVEYIDFGKYVESGFADYQTIAQQYFLLAKNEIPKLDTLAAGIGELTTVSSIPGGALYPATEDNERAVVSELYRYSVPVRVDTTYWFTRYGVTPDIPRRKCCTIEFTADCEKFEIKGSHLGFDCIILVDGVRINSNVSFPKKGNGYNSYVLVKFDEKKKRNIKLYYNDWAGFAGIVSDGEITKCAKRRLLMCADGDSVVEGLKSVNQIYSNWVGTVGLILDFDVINNGIGGSGFVKEGNGGQPNMVDRFDDRVAKYSPDILVFSAGINDWASSDSVFEKSVDEYLRKATAIEGCKVVACSPYCQYASVPEWEERKSEIVRKKALEYKVPFIDYIHAMTYDAEGNCITNNKGTEAYHNIITEENRATYLDLDSDTVHPNATGHAAIGKYIAHELYKVLNRLEGF